MARYVRPAPTRILRYRWREYALVQRGNSPDSFLTGFSRPFAIELRRYILKLYPGDKSFIAAVALAVIGVAVLCYVLELA